MSFAIDKNVLVYSSDRDSPFRETASRFLEEATKQTDLLFLAWPVIVGYLRIVTHTSILRWPLSPEEAEANVEMLLSFPNIHLLTEDASLWRTYKSVTSEIVARGNLVTDAHLASLLRHHGVRTLYTNDSDFRKFRFLEVRNPFQ